MLGVVKDAPVPKLVPPEETSYQLMVPALAVAASVNVPLSQREAGVVEDIVGVVLTVATTGALGEVHPLSVASA